MATIIAAFGQLEAETTRLRGTDSHAKLRTMDRWASGVPPLGFQTIPHPSGGGYGLAPDPEGKKILHAMAEKLLGGWSLNRIANWLTDGGYLTNVDRKGPRYPMWIVGAFCRFKGYILPSATSLQALGDMGWGTV